MKIKKLIIAMYVITAVVILCAAIYILSVGKHYVLYTNTYFDDAVVEDYSVVYENDGVVSLKDVYMSEKNEIVMEFDSVGRGDTDADIYVTAVRGDGIGKSHYTFFAEFTVTSLGVIIDTTYDTVNFQGYGVFLYAVFFVLSISLIFLIIIFLTYKKLGEYNYRMIVCVGLGMFIGILLAYLVYKWANHSLRYFYTFINEFLDIGYILFLLIAPLMVFLSILLAVSNIWLMRHEGFRPVNALGIIFGIVWTAAILISTGTRIIPVVRDVAAPGIIGRISLYLSCFFGEMFIATVICAYLATKHRPPYDRDYIIILGCCIRSDGTLTPLLKGRVDAALEFEKEQFEKTGKHAVFVPSGGKGPDEVISESHAMANYLISQGVPEDRILLEDKSVNTKQNMQFSREVIEKHAKDFKKCRIAFATTNYHIFRGYVLAKKNGFYAKGISAKTKEYFFPNAFLREYIGLLVDRKYHIIAFVLVTLFIFVLLYFMQRM